MAINTIPGVSGNSLDQLARALVSKFDSNQDGQLTTDEFTSFLTNLVGQSGFGRATAAAAQSGESPFKAATPPAMSGFSQRKIDDLNHTTIKYRFARVAQTYSLDSVKDKATAETVLNAMKPDLEQAGIKVLAVEKDRLKVLDDAGQEAWMDVIAGSCSSNPKWWWHDTRF